MVGSEAISVQHIRFHSTPLALTFFLKSNVFIFKIYIHPFTCGWFGFCSYNCPDPSLVKKLKPQCETTSCGRCNRKPLVENDLRIVLLLDLLKLRVILSEQVLGRVFSLVICSDVLAFSDVVNCKTPTVVSVCSVVYSWKLSLAFRKDARELIYSVPALFKIIRGVMFPSDVGKDIWSDCSREGRCIVWNTLDFRQWEVLEHQGR